MSPRRRQPQSLLPVDLESLEGHRAARWTRESTGKVDPITGKPKGDQWDRFGPAAQRQQQDLAIERYGLVDASIEDPSLDFKVAHSGRTVGETESFRRMLDRAGIDFDVLVVGYVSRLGRDLKTAVLARDELHRRGAAVLFADERLLTSDERQWKEWASEAVEAEAYSRRMSRRQKEGHAAKRRIGEPGGKPPFGFRREGRQPILVEIPERIALVRSMFEWSAAGLSDREVARQSGLKLTHVREILRNDIYRGTLRDGNRRPAVISQGLWDRAHEQRSRYARRHTGPTTRRQYLLSGLLWCRGCGHSLTGHVNRYRHVDPCPAFVDHRPPPENPRHRGESYRATVYEGVIPAALRHVALDAAALADIQGAASAVGPQSDPIALARIRRERQAAIDRYLVDRDPLALDATMARLDRDEAAARQPAGEAPDPAQVLNYLRDLPRLFQEAERETQRRITRALFDRVEVLGPNEIWLFPSNEAEARGWAAAMRHDFRFKIESRSGRGERI